MKLTSSPSVSSSSNTSVSGFLSFIFRKLLCSTNLPTHPSDQMQEFEPQKPDGSATPNLVARLMGLDSMPEAETNNLPLITRSKSMNSVEETQRNRAKTAVSFRETPSYFELEDDDFFVISFDNGGKNRKPRSKKAKAEMGAAEIEQKRRRRMLKDQRPRFKFEESNSEALVLEIENFGEGKSRRKKKIEMESESENSSPVSVLDHSLFISDHDVPTSENDAKNRTSSPRRKLGSELLNFEHSSSENDQNPVQSITKSKQTGLRKKGGRRRQKRDTKNKVVCRLAGEDSAEVEWMSNGGMMRNFKNWEDEIGVELSLQIVDKLVDELVHQLI